MSIPCIPAFHFTCALNIIGYTKLMRVSLADVHGTHALGICTAGLLENCFLPGFTADG